MIHRAEDKLPCGYCCVKDYHRDCPEHGEEACSEKETKWEDICSEILKTLAGEVCTPVEGYYAVPWHINMSIRDLIKQRDSLRSQLAQSVTAEFHERHLKENKEYYEARLKEVEGLLATAHQVFGAESEQLGKIVASLEAQLAGRTSRPGDNV